MSNVLEGITRVEEDQRWFAAVETLRNAMPGESAFASFHKV